MRLLIKMGGCFGGEASDQVETPSPQIPRAHRRQGELRNNVISNSFFLQKSFEFPLGVVLDIVEPNKNDPF